jgi:hypothetical protein
MLVLSLPGGMLLAIGLVLFMHYAAKPPGELEIAARRDAASAQSKPPVVAEGRNPEIGLKSPAQKESN